MEKIIQGHTHIQLEFEKKTEMESLRLAKNLFREMDQRRSVREFDSVTFSEEIIHHLISIASTAPSGAHKQPWTFCVVKDHGLKKKIREAAENEEKISYSERMSEEWLKDLQPLGTDWQKPFLEEAPYLIVVFKRIYEYGENGEKINNYYVNESVGLACGLLISAIHQVGLATLTHTPSPMNFLQKILDRPENERPFLLLPIGYPKTPCFVPKLERKLLDNVMVSY